MLDISGLNKKVTVVCATEICTNFVCTTNGAVAAHVGVIYCERCRQDRKRQVRDSYEDRNKEARRKRISRTEYEARNRKNRNERMRVRNQAAGRAKKVRGRRDGRKVLTDEQVAEIRQRFEEDGSWGLGMKLAKEYGVTTTHIYDIKNRKTRVAA